MWYNTQIPLILLNFRGDVEPCNACVSLITRITRLGLGPLLWMKAPRLVKISNVSSMIDSCYFKL